MDLDGMPCEGCGEGRMVANPGGPGKIPAVCDLCGWTADAGAPYLILDSIDDDEPPPTKRERKAAGKLYFLWVDVDPGDRDVGSRLYGVLRATGGIGRPPLLYELETKPSRELLAKVLGVKGVRGVRLVP